MPTDAEIRQKIKEIISNVTNVPVEEIGDTDRFREDLDFDSLSLLEIGVDVDYEYRLGLPEQRLQQIGSVEESVTLVRQVLDEREEQSEVA